MHKYIKNSLIFTSGAVVGFAVCGVKLITFALSSKNISKAIATEIVDRIFPDNNKRKYRGSYVSYYKYAEERNQPVNVDNSVVFDSREEAEKILNNMKYVIERYGSVTVQDFYDLCDVTNYYKGSLKYGWRNLRNCYVESTKHGWKIYLSKPELI